jgi:DNA-binding GntR family transcriptional regulator
MTLASRTETPLRGTTVEYVLAHLRDGIVQGRYAPGQRLIEADLTRDLGVSRGPLREAFRRLSAEGLIEMVPHRGALVRRLSLREMTELFQIRHALEILAVRLAAAAVRDPEVRQSFEEGIAPIWADHVRSGPDYVDENTRFHDAVANAGGNRQLLSLTRQMQLALLMYQLAGVLTPEVLAASVAEHRAVAAAILAGDVEGAEEHMRAHLERAAAVSLSMPSLLFRSGEPRS